MPTEKKTRPYQREVITLSMTGAFANGSTDFLDISPGLYYAQAHINGNLLTGGTVTLSPILPDGTVAEDYNYSMNFGATFTASNFALTDYVGIADIQPFASSVDRRPIGVYGGIRVTLASIATASATNRIDIVLQRA